MEVDEDKSESTLVQRLKYPTVHGYRLGEEIGGGGFSKYVPSSTQESC
jgi:hypothetical protein